jgi:hypothetical protein
VGWRLAVIIGFFRVAEDVSEVGKVAGSRARFVPLLCIKSRVEGKNDGNRTTATVRPFHWGEKWNDFGTILVHWKEFSGCRVAGVGKAG